MTPADDEDLPTWWWALTEIQREAFQDQLDFRDWWRSLSEAERAIADEHFAKELPIDLGGFEVNRQFAVTLRRIREIEKRALGKLRRGGDDEPTPAE